MSSTQEKLQSHAASWKDQPLSTLLQDDKHCSNNFLSLSPHITFDYSRQHFSQETLQLLLQRGVECGLEKKLHAMANGELVNNTEGRPVLHLALRQNPQNDLKIDRITQSVDTTRPTAKEATFNCDGKETNSDVQQVLDQIEVFSKKLRSGEITSATGKEFDTFIVVGIGGSYLGTQFVAEAMKFDKINGGYDQSKGKNLRFIANVDPIDFHRAIDGINYETTMVIIISKTFTTAETMKNAKLVQDWLLKQYSVGYPGITSDEIISKQFIACSTAVNKATNFGINPSNIFPFWNWVGGRYSVTSCVGILPLSLYFGYDLTRQFLAGCHDMDKHFLTAPLEHNLPIIMGLLGVWNSQYLNRPSRCVIPYAETLASFVTHIQQVDMESNGKRVNVDGVALGHPTGEVDFGTPGTNAQHSYFQLLHQSDQVIPVDFIGFIKPQCDQSEDKNIINSHDELMCNFFAQPDALAFGTDGNGNPHKLMPGNKPSSILLLSQLSFYTIGLLLALFEHRTAVQGFMWDLNSFDQYGVELGKVLANKVRDFMTVEKTSSENNKPKFIGNTQKLLSLYLNGNKQ